MTFTHPALLALLVLLPAFYVIARRRRRVPRGPWPVSLWLRLGVALLVVLALAGPRVPAPATSVATVFVVDASTSVPADIREGAKNWVRQALAKQGADDLAAIVTFGREPRVELPLGKARDHPEWGEPPPGDATDVGAALELAGDLLPPLGSGPLRRVVLLSDGNETAGDAHRALLRPHLQDVEVAVLSLPQRLQDTAITGLSVAPAVREGETLEVRAALLSPTDQEGRLRIWLQGGSIDQVLHDETVRLQNGPNEVAVTTGRLPQGSWTVRATLEVAGDSRPENNESWAFTIVGEPARVLLVEGVAGEAAAVRDALAAATIGVDARAPAQLPVQLDDLEPYESVLLANVHATDLRPEQMEVLRRFVGEQGKGLVAVGGDRSFGLGDYGDTPLEQALPVSVEPPDRDQASTLALVLVIDRSGSMETPGTSRMELAKEGAIQAVETLQMGDQVGVIAFDSTARWIAEMRPLQSPADTRAVADRIATIRTEGGTDILAAVDAAYRGLQQVSARVKHVIVLTDGEQPGAVFGPVLAAMRRAGITVSTVGIASEEGRPLLQQIARLGQGRHHFTSTPQDIPRIMTQEARLAGRSFKQERDFRPRLAAAAPAVRSLVPADLPLLHGYVRVSPKPASETVLSSDVGEPVLAQWQYGLGRALAWTSDAQGDWSRDWLGSDQFQRLWPQAVRWTMAAPFDPRLQVTVRGDGASATVRVDSLEPTGEFRNLHQTYADVALPDGSAKRLALPQTAPGRYEGRVALAGPGAYFIQVTQTGDAGEVVATQTTGYALPHLPEYHLTPANRSLLERLAADTGGPALNRVEDAWRRDTRQGLQPQDVWATVLAVALVLFVTDVAYRRLRPSPADAAVASAMVRRWLAGVCVYARRPALPRLQLHPLQAGRRRR